MDYSSYGRLQLRATSAGEALPIEGVNVRISGTDEGNVGLEHSLFTGVNGLTDTVSLPAPSPSLSRAPGAPEQAYSLYDVYAYKEGYYPKEIKDVAIFSTVKAVLSLNMIPDAGLKRDNSEPISNNYSLITENEEL